MKNEKKEPFLDRVLLHSKNADERLFDMVLRFITFVILIIIVWIYADLVHAKADTNYTTVGELMLGENELNLEFYFNDSDWNTVHQNNNDCPYTSLYNYGQVQIPGDMTLTGDMDFESYYFAMCRNYHGNQGDTQVLLFIPRQYVENKDFYFVNEDYYYASEDITCYYIYCKKSQSMNTSYYEKNDWIFESSIGNTNDLALIQNGIGSGYSTYYFCGNIPNLKGANAAINHRLWASSGDNLYDCFDSNYFKYVSDLFPHDSSESDSNHMYLKDFNIGMTGGNDILNSHVIISASWDDWVESHLQNYSVHITYTMGYVGEPHNLEDNNPDEPLIGVWTEDIPLSKLKSYHDIEFKTITNHMNINNESLKKYIQALYAAGVVLNAEPITIQDVLNGTSAEFGVKADEIVGGVTANLGVLYNYLGYQYEHPTQEVGEELMYIKRFDFKIDIVLRSSTTDISSKTGGKYWDFLKGTSVNNYDILENEYQFQGSQYNNKSENSGSSINNSNVAYGGNASASANGGNVGNITITTGNGYKDTELHQLTNQDIVQNHQKIITVIEDLKYCFHQFAQENNHNSFIQMIYDDYNYIPGIEYITTSIIIICGVCILIFIIKIAF